MPRQKFGERRPLRDAREGHDQRGADRDPDRLSVKGIAGRRVDQHRVGAEGGRIAENAADIVVVGEPDEAEDERPRRQAREEGVGARRIGPATDGEEPAMDREAGDRGHRIPSDHIDRHLARKAREIGFDRGQPVLGDENRLVR